MEPLEFVERTAPFGPLSRTALLQLGTTLEILYFPKGGRVIRWEPGTPHVYLIRKGVVRLVREDGPPAYLEEGEVFGGGQRAPGPLPVEVVAEEDLLVYRWPAEVVAEVRAKAVHAAVEETAEFLAPVSTLVRRSPVWVVQDATVGEAARKMAEEGVSSLLVVREPVSDARVEVEKVVGILTDRDLRSKVLARGLGPQTPVREVMTSPVHTVPAETPAFAAVLEMLEKRIHHLPVRREGTLVGMVTDTDLMHLQARSPLFLRKRLEAGEIDRYAREVASVADSLLGAGLKVDRICQAVSHLHEALYRRILQEAEAELGPPPAPYAWLVFGSEGRGEQVLPTDQDNALVYADGADEEYFRDLAEAGIRRLLAAGFPPCPGGYMAVRWRMPMGTWIQHFSQWIRQPEGPHLLNAHVFFDFRKVYGTLEVEPLERAVLAASEFPAFLSHMVRSCLRFRPPLGPFRRLRTQQGKLDLKLGVLVPVTCMARVLALQGRIRARSTVERLRAAADQGILSREDAEALSEAFLQTMEIRLRQQLTSWRRGEPPSNLVAVDALSPKERQDLRQALWVVQQVQEGLRLRFQAWG